MWYLDRYGVPTRMLSRIQGTDHLYKSTALGVFVATGPFIYSEHARVFNYVPGDPSATLVEDKVTGNGSGTSICPMARDSLGSPVGVHPAG